MELSELGSTFVKKKARKRAMESTKGARRTTPDEASGRDACSSGATDDTVSKDREGCLWLV